MGFFDFLSQTTRYSDKQGGIRRLEVRRDFLVTPYLEDLRDARVLDLASHDGRWSYALAAAGAREVVGIEARPELVAQFDEYPADTPEQRATKDRIRFVVGDIFEELPRMVEAGERFDVVAVYGLYYHIMDHYRLLKLVDRLGPRLVIVDSEFSTAKRALIDLFWERPESHLNTIAHTEDQERAPIGIPSRPAMDLMAESLGYRTEWADWDRVGEADRKPLAEYFRDPATHRKLRGTCALRPA